jgi:hypothetical protein
VIFDRSRKEPENLAQRVIFAQRVRVLQFDAPVDPLQFSAAYNKKTWPRLRGRQ